MNIQLNREPNSASQWRQPCREALAISLLILGLFYYWYGIADRYAIFLYGHIANGRAPAQLFDEATSSRYWMSGFVAAGATMVLYTCANWGWGQLARRRNKRFVPSAWWRVWVITLVPLSVGILLITMTLNTPTLPLPLALVCLLSTLLSLIIALLPGKWAAEQPWDLLWLVADGSGFIPPLLLIHVIEFADQGTRVSSTLAWSVAIGAVCIGTIWLIGMSKLRQWRHKTSPSAVALFLSGLGLSYLLLPLVHYLLLTPPTYRYITTAENFFARDLRLQLIILLIAASLAAMITRWRHRLAVQ